MSGLLLTEQPVRRGFLRALIAAPAAALATHRLILPAQTLVTPDDAAARLAHHVAGVEAAMRDLFPGTNVRTWGNCLNGAHVHYAESFARDASGVHAPVGGYASIGFDASLPELEGC